MTWGDLLRELNKLDSATLKQDIYIEPFYVYWNTLEVYWTGSAFEKPVAKAKLTWRKLDE